MAANVRRDRPPRAQSSRDAVPWARPASKGGRRFWYQTGANA